MPIIDEGLADVFAIHVLMWCRISRFCESLLVIDDLVDRKVHVWLMRFTIFDSEAHIEVLLTLINAFVTRRQRHLFIVCDGSLLEPCQRKLIL